jgi:hypothetical protein
VSHLLRTFADLALETYVFLLDREYDSVSAVIFSWISKDVAFLVAWNSGYFDLLCPASGLNLLLTENTRKTS